MDERPEQPGTCELLEMRTRLGEPAADALDVPDREAAADEGVERDAARHMFRRASSHGRPSSSSTFDSTSVSS